MASISKLMKKASRMQKEIAEAQAKLADRTVEASSGGGAVKVVAKCDGTVESISIDPGVLEGDDTAMLEDLVLTAVNNGLVKANEVKEQEMDKLTQSYGIPGLTGI